MMSVKDFVWEDKRVKWVPLGQGQVRTAEFLKLFRETRFGGPISMYFGYENNPISKPRDASSLLGYTARRPPASGC
jgi:hypothetical protein